MRPNADTSLGAGCSVGATFTVARVPDHLAHRKAQGAASRRSYTKKRPGRLVYSRDGACPVLVPCPRPRSLPPSLLLHPALQ